ncbi:myb-like protein X isoform X3 [Triticum aestivum]|uniref:myb-like protein X isoform X3 n=1 Tax=Triticum aestivum TaxID=4565 RepID=UPI001D033D7D|nr:myb-like protein X isoform X3 [Triticum aestivum]
MVHQQKQYSNMGMIDDKQNVKVKEGGGENTNAKEKKKQSKEEGDKKKEVKKMTKYKEKKERMRGNDKDNEKEKEDQRKMKENEKKMRAHKEREEKKENDKEEELKEQNDTKNCPQFFRSLMTSSSMEQETIPEDCHKYLEECTGTVSLRGPSGNLWPVELAKISGELCFARGWKEFLCDHCIVYGYLLVFRYDGNSQFSVTVFSPSSCEAPYAFLAQPQRMGATAVAANDENGHTGTNADGTAPQEEDSHIGTAADGTPQNEEEEDASEEYEGSDNMSVDADGAGPQKEEEDALSENPDNEEESEWRSAPSQQQKEDQDKIDNGFVVGKRTRFRKVDDIMTEVVRSKKSKAKEGKRHEAQSSDSKSEGEALESGLRPPRKSKATEEKRPEAPSGDSLAELVRRSPKKSKAEGKRSTALASKGAASSDSLKESKRRPPRKPKAAKGKRPRAPCGHSESEGAASGDSLAELVRRPPKKSRTEGKGSAASSASKGMTSSHSLAVHTGVFAPESVCKDLTKLHKSFGKKHSMKAQFPMFNKSNSENQPGRVIVKVQRRPELESQRRPITQRDKEYAMERARRFQSKRPFVIKEIKHTNVYVSYFMIIPDMFVENFLPKESRKMTLWDPQAKPWKVWYEYTGGECPRAAFSAGWGALAMENYLENRDLCVFELLDDDYNIKLHVYRAVLDITPFALAPKHRQQGCA